VYLHCHHGKHRGPAAAAASLLCLDGKCPTQSAVEILRRAGTDPRYTGLFASVESLTRPSAEELAGLPTEFPEVAVVTGFVQNMVAVDETWDRLKLVRKADWRAPANHADLDPAHEALQLVEHYREAARLPEVKARPADFRARLSEAESAASELEKALRAGPKDAEAERAFTRSAGLCAKCHAAYRDVPQEGGR
jgi:hypothetical protein